MNRQAVLLLLVVCLTALALLMSCSDDNDCLVCPDIINNPPACDVYLSHARSNNLFHYSTANPGKFDSIPIGPEESRLGSIGIANDGIHLVNGADNGVTIYNIQTGEIVKTLPYKHCWVNVSRTGQYIALLPTADDTETPHIYILDGETFEVIRQTEYYSGRACFSTDDKILYYRVYGTIHIIAYDIEGDSVYQEFDYFDNDGVAPSIINFQITDDESEMYLLVQYSLPRVGEVHIYNIEQDTTTAVFDLWYATRDMVEITPDGKQIVVTDPGDVMFDEFGSQDVIFFDTEDGNMSSRVPMNCIFPGEMEISADGRYTFIVGSFSAGFAVVDNLTHQYYDSFCLFGDGETVHYSFYGVTCRRILTN